MTSVPADRLAETISLALRPAEEAGYSKEEALAKALTSSVP